MGMTKKRLEEITDLLSGLDPEGEESRAILDLLNEVERLQAFEATCDPAESSYWRAVRTGEYPEIWPPVVMSPSELAHFRRQCEMDIETKSIRQARTKGHQHRAGG